MRFPGLKYHFGGYLIVPVILSCLTFGWFGYATERPLALDRLSGSKISEYRLDKGKISEVVSRIESGKFGKIHSLIIIQNDVVILEKYFMGWHRHRLHQIFSVTKSVASSLIGMAIEQGLIEGVDLKLIDAFPEYHSLENMDPRKNRITLENLLSMTAGYQWNELSVPYKNDDGSWNPNNDINKMRRKAKDSIKYVLDLPLVADPGGKFIYNSGCSKLLAAIIKRKTGKSAEEYAAEYLFKPLTITTWKWLKTRDGITDSGGGLFLYPADMAMFGYLFLKNGKFNGNQIVSEGWVNRSTERHVSTIKAEYGYQWWRFKKSTGKEYSEIINTAYYALGIGDQAIFVIPKANMVVVSTADNLLHRGKRIYNILFEHILPALKFNGDLNKQKP